MNAVEPESVASPRLARRRRALAARQLLEVHAQGALESPSRWDWDTLGELPPWCLLGEVDRRRLQGACGLVFLGPELPFVVDGATLRAAGELIGPEALERVLDDAVSTFGEGDVLSDIDTGRIGDTGVARTGGILGVAADAVEERLLGIGSSVLQATLGERLEAVLPLEALRAALGPARLGSLERVTAERVLERAERLLAGGA